MNSPKRVGAVLAICLTAILTAPARAGDTLGADGVPHSQSEGLSAEAKAFLLENEAAMDRMMAAMHQPPMGDIDRDFVMMMIPHHQGAIDMARAVLRSSRNEPLRRLAHEIIITQEAEIRALRMTIEPHAPHPAAANTAGGDQQ